MTVQTGKRPPLIVKPVVTSDDLKTFIRLPSRIYADIPGYVPPLTLERDGQLDPKQGPFFKHGTVQYWLAYRGNEALGRISAQIDHVQPDGAFEDAGLFGCFDAVDDLEVTAALLKTAEDWLATRGYKKAAGPFLLSMNGEPGLLVEGQSEPPLFLVSWHPKYLGAHLPAAGYTARKDLHYWRLSDLQAKAEAVQKRQRHSRLPAGFTIRNLDMKNLARDVGIIRHMYNDAWQGNWGFVPLQPEDTEGIVKEMKFFVKPEYGIVMEHDGEPAGVAMVLPNLYEITTGLGPEPSPFGWAQLLARALTHRFATGNVLLLGIASRYRHSVGGAVLAMRMVDEIITRLLAYKVRTGWLEAGWVLDNNTPLRKILERQGFEPKRTLRIFDKNIGN